jgi:hypothetical protein
MFSAVPADQQMDHMYVMRLRMECHEYVWCAKLTVLLCTISFQQDARVLSVRLQALAPGP